MHTRQSTGYLEVVLVSSSMRSQTLPQIRPAQPSASLVEEFPAQPLAIWVEGDIVFFFFTHTGSTQDRPVDTAVHAGALLDRYMQQPSHYPNQPHLMSSLNQMHGPRRS